MLTDFGKLVVEFTKEMVATEGELLRRIGLLAGLETGAVKVALGPYPIVMSAYAATGKLIAKYPKLNVSLQAMNWRDVCRLVTEKKVDLGVAELTDAVLDESLQTDLVGRHQARFFCRPGHPILGRSRVALADLLEFPWATTRMPRRLAAAFPRPIGSAGHIDAFNGDFVPAIELDVPMHFARLYFRRERDRARRIRDGGKRAASRHACRHTDPGAQHSRELRLHPPQEPRAVASGERVHAGGPRRGKSLC